MNVKTKAIKRGRYFILNKKNLPSGWSKSKILIRYSNKIGEYVFDPPLLSFGVFTADELRAILEKVEEMNKEAGL